MIADPQALLNLNKLICYLFTAVSLSHLIQIDFVPKSFDYLFEQFVSPFIYSQVISFYFIHFNNNFDSDVFSS